MRLKFRKQRFAGNRTFQPNEVAEVDDELAGRMIADKSAFVTDEDLTDFTAEPKDPPKVPKK